MIHNIKTRLFMSERWLTRLKLRKKSSVHVSSSYTAQVLKGNIRFSWNGSEKNSFPVIENVTET